MTDDFAKMMAAMLAQGQDMARAFAPAAAFGSAGMGVLGRVRERSGAGVTSGG